MTTLTWFLFALRLISAACLLTFLAGLMWYLRNDLLSAELLLGLPRRDLGNIIINLPQQEERRYPLRTVTTIGRSPKNLIVLDNNYTSGQHALITRQRDQWWLEDLQSRNGTLLNEQPLYQRTIIRDGDIITIGQAQLRIEL